MNFGKKLICWYVAFVLIPLFSFSKEEVAEKQYPPYPDVWGYDLSDYQAVRENMSYISAFDAPNGDIVFIFRAEGVPGDDLNQENIYDRDKMKAIKFFERKIVDISEDLDTFVENNHLARHQEKTYHGVEFEDGIQVEYYYDDSGKLCSKNNLDRWMFIKGKPKKSGFVNPYDKNSEVYSVIAAMPNIVKRGDIKGEPECPESSEVTYQQFWFIATDFVQLKDNTFILFSDNRNLILRFDKNLKTKFKPEHGVKGTKLKRNFFVIPHSIFNEIIDRYECKEPWVQAMHDRLIEYLEEQQENGKFD